MADMSHETKSAIRALDALEFGHLEFRKIELKALCSQLVSCVQKGQAMSEPLPVPPGLPTHPPIPPDCPYFRQVHGLWHLAAPLSYNNDAMLPFSAIESRPIIAAFARCAWLDERQNDTSNPDWEGHFELCERNAEAWRVWATAPASSTPPASPPADAPC